MNYFIELFIIMFSGNPNAFTIPVFETNGKESQLFIPIKASNLIKIMLNSDSTSPLPFLPPLFTFDPKSFFHSCLKLHPSSLYTIRELFFSPLIVKLPNKSSILFKMLESLRAKNRIPSFRR